MSNDYSPNPVAELFKQLNPVLPSNCLFNKVVTGCGATSLEIENLSRNSIITVPYRSLIDNKVSAYPNSRTPPDFELLGVKGGVDNDEINEYLIRNIGHPYKIMVTWDSLPRIIEAIDFFNIKYDHAPLSDFFLLIDEAHCLLNSYLLRKEAIQGVLQCYTRVREWCFLTATPHGGDFVLEELQDVEVIVAEGMMPEKITVKNIETQYLESNICKVINDYLNPQILTNAHIFCNSVTFIAKIVKKLSPKLTNKTCKIVWSESNEKFKDNVQGITRGTPGSDPKKINFYTSTCFEGCDIFDKDGETIIISDGYQSQTLNDIYTTFRQITGRIRNTNYKSPVYHFYRKCRYSSNDLSYEEFKDRSLKKVDDAYHLAKTYNLRLVYDEEEEILNKHYITREKDDRFSYDSNLWRHDLLNYKITHNSYIEIENLRRDQAGADMIPKALKVGKTPSDRLSDNPEARLTFKSAFSEYLKLVNNRFKESQNIQVRLQVLRDKYEFIDDVFILLGPEKVKSLNYRIKAVKDALTNISDLPHRHKIKQLLLENIERLGIIPHMFGKEKTSFITNAQGKQILKEAYETCGISKTPIARDLEKYYFVATPGKVGTANGFFLNGDKEIPMPVIVSEVTTE